MKNALHKVIPFLRTHVHHRTFAYGYACLAFVDYFLLLVPIFAVFVGLTILNAKGAMKLAFLTIIGSTLGALAYAYSVQAFGPELIHKLFPKLFDNPFWFWSEEFLKLHGTLGLFIISLLPLADHPAITLLAMANVPIRDLIMPLLFAKVIKYFGVALLVKFAPHHLKRFT